MAMAQLVSSLQHIHLTSTLTARLNTPRTLQVTCKAQISTGTPKSSGVRKKTKPLKRKNVEKPSGGKKESREKEDEEGFAVIPQTSEWINSKPPGFGVGKEYTTSLEDELLADIEREEELRAAAEARKQENESSTEKKKKKKKSAEMSAEDGDLTLKKEEPKPMQRITLRGDKVVERKTSKPKAEKKPQLEEPAGVKVKLTHLPKKKNIRKDLRDAFKDVQGLLFIKPNELANKKTRDPLCKGSALLTFANEEKAKFFIEKFKARKLQFGKVEKVITYELLPEKVEAPMEEVQKPVPRLPVREPEAAEVVTVQGEPVSEGLVSNTLDERETEDEDEAEDDVVLDAIVSASLDEDTEDESLDEDDDDEEEDDDDDGLDDEDLTFGSTRAGFEGMELSNDLEYDDSDDEDELSEEEEEHDDTRADMDVSDGEYSDEEIEFPEEEAELEPDDESHRINEEGYVEVDVSLPLTVKELEGDPEEIIHANTEKMEELDKQISQLKKRLKRKKSAELEARILKLREEKIELLEKRVLARVVAAREAFRAKRAARQQESGSKPAGRKLRVGDEELKEVVSKHFTGPPPSSR